MRAHPPSTADAPRGFVSDTLQILAISLTILSLALIGVSVTIFLRWRSDRNALLETQVQLAATQQSLARAEAELQLHAAAAGRTPGTLGQVGGLPLEALLQNPETMRVIGEILRSQPDLQNVLQGDNAGELLQLGLQVLDAYQQSQSAEK